MNKNEKKCWLELDWLLMKWNFLIWYFLAEHNNHEFGKYKTFLQKREQEWPLFLNLKSGMHQFETDRCVCDSIWKWNSLNYGSIFLLSFMCSTFGCVDGGSMWPIAMPFNGWTLIPYARHPKSKRQSTINRAISVFEFHVFQWIHQFC